MNVAFDANIAFKKYEWMNDWNKSVNSIFNKTEKRNNNKTILY